MTPPSKELLSEVLDECVFRVCDMSHNPDYNDVFKLEIERPSGIGQVELEDFEIDHYYLAYKCKEWAYGLGYYFIIKPYVIEIYSSKPETELLHIIILVDSIPYNVQREIEACEWILQQKNDNK